MSKNDRNDSGLLAQLGRTNPELLSPVRLRSQSSQQHRTINESPRRCHPAWIDCYHDNNSA